MERRRRRRAAVDLPNAGDKIDKTVCTPYDGAHRLPLLVGETDLQIVVKVVLCRRGAAAAAAARASEPLEDGAQRGLERVGRAGRRRLQRGRARPPRGRRHHRLERAAPQPFEHDPVVLLATRSPAPLHLNLTYV